MSLQPADQPPARARPAMPPAAAAYIRAFEEYLEAPRDQRDQWRVRQLCDDALAELLAGDR